MVFACHVAAWFVFFVLSFMIVSVRILRKCCGSHSHASQQTGSENLNKGEEDSEQENLMLEYQE